MNTSPEVVMVTGASSGIGWELAKCFAADKSNLVLVARNRDALEKLSAELQAAHGIKVHILSADLSRPETPQRIFQELSAQNITVDVLVNNAGFGLHGEFLDLPLSGQLDIIHVNITALTELTGLFLPGMIQRRRGGILNVGSVAGFLPGPNLAVYYASKAFVLSFTEALAEETCGTGLKISVLCPGPTESNFGNVARGGKSRQVERPKMSAQTVAQIGHQEFRAGKVVVVPGISNKLLAFLPRISPRKLARRVVKKYNRTKK
ncbi:MAG: SDR family oxidoreductase [Verrucomicrobiota bacterium]